MTPAERTTALCVLDRCRAAGIVVTSHVRLALVLHEHGELRAGVLCKATGYSSAIIGPLVQQLSLSEEPWLLERRDIQDRRCVLLRLSDRARAILDGEDVPDPSPAPAPTEPQPPDPLA